MIGMRLDANLVAISWLSLAYGDVAVDSTICCPKVELVYHCARYT